MKEDEEMDYNEILKSFVESREWAVAKEVLLNKVGLSSSWIVNPDGEFFFREEHSKPYCKMINATPAGKKECDSTQLASIQYAQENKVPTVFPCHAGFLGFTCPIMSDGTLIGIIGGCQVVNSALGQEDYAQVIKRFNLDSNAFSTSLSKTQSTTVEALELDVELVAMLTQLSIESKIKHQQLSNKEGEVETISEFYKLFEESRSLILTLEPKKLYPLIVNLTARVMNAEIASLMIIDEKTQDITIKAAIGLDEEHIAKTKLKVGKGVVGYVAKTGEPLLVSDITQDTRFHVKKSSPKYYTKSLITAPLKVGNEVIGVINVNNMKTRRPFNETDLKLLSIICGHAAVAIKNARKYYSEEKEKVTEEIEKEMREKEKVTQDKQELIKERDELEIQLKEKEEMIRVKEELIRVKQELLREKMKVAEEEEEQEKLLKEVETLEKEKNTLVQERNQLLEKVKKTDELIKEKENLEKEKEELIREKEELEAQTEELGILYSISREIPLMKMPQEILSWVLDKIQPFFNYHAGTYLLVDDNRLISEIKQVCYINQECIQDIKDRIEKKWAEINPQDTRKIIYHTDEGTSSELFWVGIEKFQSSLMATLNHRDEIIGLLALNSFNEDAFTPLQRRLLTIIANQISETLEKVKLFAKIRELAERDELTKVYNYRYFEDYLEKEFAFAKQYNKQLSLTMLDFDRLKYVNDTYGHQAGNRLIKTISDIIKETIKDKGVLARFGGDEFAVILSETDQNTAFSIAEAIRTNIAKKSIEFVKGKPHRLSASLGVSTYPNQGIETEKDLLAKADKALYEAKQRGRNKVVAYTP
jgi:diguanylate cyclase (GGDEF)-like protein